MQQKLAYISLLVADYDEAITYYTQKLNFKLVEDTPQHEKRWVLIAPPGGDSCQILLAKAKNKEELTRIGNQTGGRVFLFLQTNDFWRDYHAMKQQGVEFSEEPREESYATVVVFKDLYGNKWDLLQVKSTSH